MQYKMKTILDKYRVGKWRIAILIGWNGYSTLIHPVTMLLFTLDLPEHSMVFSQKGPFINDVIFVIFAGGQKSLRHHFY